MLTLVGEPGDIVSLIPLQPGDSTVSTIGFLYTLKNEPLIFGTTRGMSNLLTQKQGTIHLESGLLVVVHTRLSIVEDRLS
jgi:thiamine pyrophosphokinase